MLAVTERFACHDMMTGKSANTHALHSSQSGLHACACVCVCVCVCKRETNPTCDIQLTAKRGNSFRKENTPSNTFLSVCRTPFTYRRSIVQDKSVENPFCSFIVAF